MKRIISIIILFGLILIALELGITHFKKGHEVSYQIINKDKIFEVQETYYKEYNNTYDLVIKIDNNTFYYQILNNFNKQKQIIENILYYEKDNDLCIYPVLKNNELSYLECIKNNQLYSSYTYPDTNMIESINNDLKEKGYIKEIEDSKTDEYNKSTIYKNNLLETDTITLWNYKGIQIIKSDKYKVNQVLGFDKYENNHGYLVDHYYIIPVYTSSKINEFNKVKIIDLNNQKDEMLNLEYTLSSNTYINGVIDNKLYYTDPSNLIQIEINPSKNSSRLIGSKELGGQYYNGKWQDKNIYDFVNTKIKFTEEIPSEIKNNNYVELLDSGSSYYYYNQSGEIYQVLKTHLDNPILINKVHNISNFNVVDNNIYYVSGDSLYRFDLSKGSIIILKNNELRYNKINRISIFRKSS